MSSSFQRFEILLPLRFNDGREVPESQIADVLLALETRFGAVSAETQVIQGRWTSEQRRYRDDLVRVFVDAIDSEETRRFFAEFKRQLKERFEQLDIWVTTYPIEIL